jgi:hypothetical protein
VRRSSAGLPHCRRKRERPARAAQRRFGRPRPKWQYTAGSDPAVKGQTAHPCLADDLMSQMETSATVVVVVAVAVVVAVVAVGAAATGTGSQLQAVVGTSQEIEYQLLSRHQYRPRADSR